MCIFVMFSVVYLPYSLIVMKSRNLIFLFVALFTASVCRAQGVLQFTQTEHEFGNVTEGTQATHEFTFTNTGNAPVIISNVSASCGCTTPYWTKEPVLPGKKGKVTASYNSAGRPGVFHKTITVVSNAQPASHTLTIKGTVAAKTATVVANPVSPEAVAQSSTLTLKERAHQFGKIERNKTISHTFAVSNTGQSDLRIDRVQSACNCVTFSLNKYPITPGSQAALELRYTPRSLHQQNETVTVFSNDLQQPTVTVTLQANVVESLATQNMLKEQKTMVPFR